MVSQIKKHTRNVISKPSVLPVIALVALVGSYFIYNSFAATTLNPKAVKQSDSSVLVSWSSVDNAANYRIGRDGTDADGSGPWSTTDPSNTSSRLFDKLLLGSLTYTFTVVALNSQGGVIASASVSCCGASSNSADINQDSKVDIVDLSILLSDWNNAGRSDINKDNKVDIVDLSILLSAWGQVVVDSQAPTKPANLKSDSVTQNSIKISWGASSDNLGVAGYSVYRNGIKVADSSTTSFTDSNLAAGTSYNYQVDAVDAAGNRSAKSNQVSATTSGGSVGNSTKLPLVGLSGLPWNAGVFKNSASGVQAFENWRGRKTDAVMVFAARDNWNDMNWMPGGILDHKDRVRVLAVPPFPKSLGTGGLAQVAAGQHNGFWQNWGKILKDNGLNDGNMVVRLGWEFNGSWYPWSAHDPSTFAEAYRQVVKSVRLNAPNVKFNWCMSKGPSHTNDWAAYPGNEYVDIIGLDIYDHWGPAFNDSQFNSEANKTASLNDIADFARSNNKQMSLDEWGVSHWKGDAGGGDNPFFIQKMWDWLNANKDVVAYEITYDDAGAPSTLKHKLSPPEGPTWNPNASAKYNSLW